MDEFFVPPHEAARLRVLDTLGPLTSTTDAFTDSVARAAAGIVGTPMSAISLVGAEHLWVGSNCNLQSGVVPRDITFCSHTVLGQAPFVVPDARQDPRFIDNPFVVGPPYIRFYAGFPLIVASRSIGALCVVDDLPREVSADQLARLTQLAAGVAAWLALKREVAT